MDTGRRIWPCGRRLTPVFRWDDLAGRV